MLWWLLQSWHFQTLHKLLLLNVMLWSPHWCSVTTARLPVAFFSRPLAQSHLGLPTFEKELIELVKAIKHQRLYLWGQQFHIKTDQYGLTFLLEQSVLNPPQQHLISKLLGSELIWFFAIPDYTLRFTLWKSCFDPKLFLSDFPPKLPAKKNLEA